MNAKCSFLSTHVCEPLESIAWPSASKFVIKKKADTPSSQTEQFIALMRTAGSNPGFVNDMLLILYCTTSQLLPGGLTQIDDLILGDEKYGLLLIW